MSLRPSERAEIRRNKYKVAVDAEEGRRRREDNMVEIRKNRREESLLKKRREGMQAQQMQQQAFAPSIHASALEKKLESLPAMVAGVYSDDSTLQLEATTQFRKLLSIERSPPIEEVIASGVVPRFVEFLTREDYPQLQFEAAWALTNIASGTSENTKVVIDHGAVPIFVKLLSSPSDDVREQAVWALGNVAGDSPRCRDLVLAHGALFPLLQQLNEHAKLSMLRNATWTLSNFCRGKPQPAFEQVKPALPALQRLIHSNDEEVLTDACWALSYLSDGTNDKIQAVIEAGVCPRLVELLLHPSPSVLIPALRTVGNICVIDHQALQCLLNLLTHNHKKSIKKEACWTISNITAGNKDQIQVSCSQGCIKRSATSVCPDPRIVTVA
ncbi:Importin subunit alpha-1a [Ananas comosus]|uniref:Importin subunit alpha-1a n=1 Tax=Ananas comosus TaxID=4615 RepID=A0A199V5G2_ANACO|nr:Importin subunit alpha-1a [Ananas comosus]